MYHQVYRTKQTARKSTGSRVPAGRRVYRPAQQLRQREGMEVIKENSNGDSASRETSSEPDASGEEEPDSDESKSTSVANEVASGAQEEDAGTDVEEEDLDDHSFLISPKHSYGANFDKDLKNCLSGKTDVARNPCHFELLPSAPNPCLNIDGLGSIGVPLSSREAQVISNFVNDSKEPETKTVAANSWTIDASLVSFDNPQWTKFLRKTVGESVWSGLGIAPRLGPVECVFDKLVLCGPGPLKIHEQGDNDHEAFSKIVIQLPSAHAGGRVYAFYGAQETYVDLAEHPLATSILASYTSATLTFAPITEGYRLALVYNLISELPDSRPDLPTESLMTLQLRRILNTWNDDGYKGAPPGRRFVYILEQRKKPLSERRRRKQPTFTPKDQEFISCLRDAAKELGAAVFSGQLSYFMQGESDEGAQDSCDDVYGYDYNIEAMSIVNVKKTSASFQDLVDSDGNAVDGAYVDLEVDDIAPSNFFAGLRPDSRYYEPAFPNLDYSYYRNSVLVVPEDEAERILRGASPQYWLSKLETLDPAGPEQLDPEKVDSILWQLGTSEHDGTLSSRLIKLALKWKDLDLWARSMLEFRKTRSQNKFEDFVEAWNVFSFQRLLPSLSTMLLDVQSTEHLLDFVKKVEDHAPAQDREDVFSWATGQYTNVIASIHPMQSYRVPEIIRIGQERGASFLGQTLIPHLVAHPPGIDFIHSLYYKLQENMSTIPNSHLSNPAIEGSEMTAGQVASTCLENALKQPKHKLYAISSLQKLSLRDHHVFSRLKAAIQLYLSTGRIQECAVPLRLLLHTSAYKDYVGTYSQIVTDLREWLEESKHSVTIAPFKYFFAAIIGLHMQHLLNSTRPNFETRISNFGCGECEYCRRINQFFHNRKQTRFHERIYAKDRKHIEPFLASFSVAQHQIASAHGYTTKPYLTLTKHADLQAFQAWEENVNSAKAYLNRIGTDAEIALLMESEYPKLQESLKGVRVYTASRRFKKALGDVTEEALEFSPPPVSSTSQPVLTTSSSNIQTQATNAVAPTKQKKRKATVAENRPSKRTRIEQSIDHETIDLTSSP